MVSAARTEIPVELAGSAVTIIDRGDIERRHAAFAIDLLRTVPGLAVSTAGPVGAQSQVRIRGAEANHVLVLIDGIEVNDPSAGDEFSFEHLMTHDIERIEIVRGPQSALWGSDAVAGVVNIVTMRGARQGMAALDVHAGSFGTTGGSASWSVARDDWQLRFGASGYGSDGENVSRSGDEDDGYRNTQASLAMAWQPTTFSVLEMGLRHTQARAEFDGTDFFVTGLPADTDDELDSAMTYARISADIAPAGSWRYRAALTWADTDRDSLSDGHNVSRTGADRMQASLQATVALGDVDFDADGHRLTVAVDHERQTFRQQGAASFFGDPNQSQSWNNTGWVLELHSKFTRQFTSQVSVRADSNSEFEDIVTLRASGSYRLPGTGTRFRAAYGTGQKAPTFIERYGFFPNSFVGNPNLEPEKSRGWEIGVSQELPGARAYLELNLFGDRLRDEIDGFVFDPTTFLFTAANRDGSSRRRGLEAVASFDLTESLSASASWTWLDADEPDGSGGYREELRRPRQSGALNVTYAGSGRWRANLSASWNGRRKDLFFPPFPEPSRTVVLGDYLNVSIAGSFDLTERVSLYGRIDNALDTDYEDVFGFATPGLGLFFGVRVAMEAGQTDLEQR